MKRHALFSGKLLTSLLVLTAVLTSILASWESHSFAETSDLQTLVQKIQDRKKRLGQSPTQIIFAENSENHRTLAAYLWTQNFETQAIFDIQIDNSTSTTNQSLRQFQVNHMLAFINYRTLPQKEISQIIIHPPNNSQWELFEMNFESPETFGIEKSELYGGKPVQVLTNSTTVNDQIQNIQAWIEPDSGMILKKIVQLTSEHSSLSITQSLSNIELSADGMLQSGESHFEFLILEEGQSRSSHTTRKIISMTAGIEHSPVAPDIKRQSVVPVSDQRLENTLNYYTRGELLNLKQLQELATKEKNATADNLKGDVAVSVQLEKYDGISAKGSYALKGYTYLSNEVLIESKEVPSDGRLDFGNLSDLRQYSLSMDDLVLARFKPSPDPAKNQLKLIVPPKAGDEAPDVELVDVWNGTSSRLSDLRGKVIFLDFWATWCGPCQEPMAHNNTIMKRRNADWQDKAAIIAVSIDDQVSIVQKHLKRNEWTSFPQYFAAGDRTGFKSMAAQAYIINQIPTGILIDKAGKIIWRGHPSKINIEQEIDRLIGTRK